MNTCRRFTLGADTVGWRAICLDCTWVSEYAEWTSAKVLGDAHVVHIVDSDDTPTAVVVDPSTTLGQGSARTALPGDHRSRAGL